jgi:ankyrin repeat protein
MYAAAKGHTVIANSLIAAGASLDVKIKYEMTALMAAA